MDATKVSIVIPVLNSHEILRRQFLHFENIGIPEGVEIIIVDDGSEPKLEYNGKLPARIHYTNDKRPWTWALARNAGAKLAKGEYLLMFDIDHILTRKLINAVMTFNGQKMQFQREFGVLLEDGSFTQELSILQKYGFPLSRLKNRNLSLPPLPNNFAMRRDVFFELGCYREDLVNRPYPQGEDRSFRKKWHEWESSGKGHVHTERPMMYMFPNGYYCGDVDFNPFNLFHTTTRKTRYNYRYNKKDIK